MTRPIFTLILLLASAILGCSAPLRPCPVGQVRGWCAIDVSARTFAELEAHCEPHVQRTTVTACVNGVPSGDPGAAIAIILKVTDWLRTNYRSKNGILDYIMKGDLIIDARFALDERGRTMCNTVAGDTNPYGGPIVNLDVSSRHPIAHALDVDGGATASDDCATCLGDACPSATGPDLDACVHDHCAALCPTSSGGAGVCGGDNPFAATDTCSGAGADCAISICCPGLLCYTGDLTSTCM